MFKSITQMFASQLSTVTEIGGTSSITKLEQHKYDVFLSFRGEDTRDNFTSHLFEALRRKHIEVYIDNKLNRGDTISDALMTAIQGSKLAVLIFSEHYAESSWCLDELVQIIKCRETSGMIVVPVFYGVDPSDIRKQRGLYKVAVSQHHKAALTKAANLSGWDSANIRPEAELVDYIVGDIIQKLRGISPAVDFTGLFGIPERLKEVESMFEIGSSNVRIIGIWGMGGIGKTTLAKVVYHRLSFQFEACCYLGNVRDEWEEGRKEYYLQNKLIRELFKDEDVQVDNIYRIFDRNRLLRKKVLIVLDDIDDARQLKIVGGRDWFGPGSRILITSRDYQALKGSDAIYHFTKLSQDDALQLFQSIAFGTTTLTGDQIRSSNKVVNEYGDCNPLALINLASTLQEKCISKWDQILRNIRESPDEDVQKLLEISYYRLREEKKTVFLDIACFFNREKRDFVERILDGCGFSADDGIRDLINKSLLTIVDHNKLWMQHLIEAMGREIVRKESAVEPGQRSRLWKPQDLCDVFRHDLATASVQGIVLDMCKIETVNVSPAVFSKMYNLRVLKFHNHFGRCMLNFPPGHLLQLLPDKLRYLYWDDYPFPSLPLEFTGANLVELKMQFSQVRYLWQNVQRLNNLRVLDLSFSKQLFEIPNLSKAPNIETLRLKGCKLVREVPSYFKDLEKLISLDLEDCSSLEKVLALPNNIAEVNLTRCEELKILPENIHKLDSLTRLQLAGCSKFDYNEHPEIMSLLNELA